MHKLSLRIHATFFISLILATSIFNIYPPLMVNAGASITIKGRLMVHHMGDPDEDVIPVANARVEVYDEEIIEYPFTGWGRLPWPDTYLGAVYTDSQGYFTFTVNNNDGSTVLGDERGRDIYVKLVASNRAASVMNNPGWLAGSVYQFKTDTRKNMADGETWNLGSIEPGSSEHQLAFDVLATVDKAWRHIRAETGVELKKINVFYMDFFTLDNSYHMADKIGDYLDIIPVDDLTGYFPPQLIDFLREMKEIWGSVTPIQKGMIRDLAGIHLHSHVSSSTRRFHEVIFHEYGHFIMGQVFELGPPFTVAGTHYVNSEYNIEHAWVEGWAEFYSSVARQHYGVEEFLDISGYNIESPDYGLPEDAQRDSVEGVIASILWDIYDANNEGQDRLTTSFGELARIIKNYDPDPNFLWPIGPDKAWNIYQVFDALRHTWGPEDVSRLWVLMNSHGVTIPDTTPPSNPTSYTSSHNSVIGRNDLTIEVDLHGASDDLSGLQIWYRFHPPGVNPLNLEAARAAENIGWYLEDSQWAQPQTGSHVEFDCVNFNTLEWYLSVVTLDNAGNLASEVFRAGPFLLQEQPMLQMEGVISNHLGQVILGSQSEVTVNDPPTYEGKAYTKPFLRIGDIEEEDEVEFSEVINFINRPEGYYEIKVYELKGPSTEVAYSYQLFLDTTPPTVDISIGEPSWGGDHVCSDTPFTVTAEDSGAGVQSMWYSLDGASWVPYTAPFHIIGPDGAHTIQYRAVDYVGNMATGSESVNLDNTPPGTTLEVGAPHVASDETYVTGGTELSIHASDSGCGVEKVEYRSPDTDDEWTPYTGPFTLEGLDGEYTVAYRAVDNLGNAYEDALTLVNDNAGPQIHVASPAEGFALQDTVEFRVGALDPCGVAWVRMSIRRSGEPDAPIGFEDMGMMYDSEAWALDFNTLQLPDGDYLVRYTASDGLGNQETSEIVYSVRNWVVVELLPSSQTNKAGRTMPVKFSLRVSPDVDPDQPFVYNADLVIRIYWGGDLLQESIYGDASTDYRIDLQDEQYVTNFKTLKTPGAYTVEVCRGDFLLGSFTFATTR